MNAGGTAERVYGALKSRLLEGTITPGAKLDPARFADELFSSVTPVREALHRLAGERLVEMRISGGFFLPRITEPGLRDLYAWNAALVRFAVRLWPKSAGDGADEQGRGGPADTAAVFAACAARSGNVELIAGIAAAGDRLAAPRAAETSVLSGLSDEAVELAHAFNMSDRYALLALSQALLRRRLRAVPAIVRQMYLSGR